MSFEGGDGFSVMPEIEYGYVELDEHSIDKKMPLTYLWHFEQFTISGVMNNSPLTRPHVDLTIMGQNNLTLKVQDKRKQKSRYDRYCLKLFDQTKNSYKILWSSSCVGKEFHLEFDVEIVDDSEEVIFSETMTFTVKKGSHYYIFEAI